MSTTSLRIRIFASAMLFIVSVALISAPAATHASARFNIPFTSMSLNAGLVGWWTFDGKDMVQNVKDVSGAGNNGSLVGYTSTSSVLGMAGQALRFDGATQYVNLGTGLFSIPAGSTQITLSAWVKPDAFTDFAAILGKSVEANPYGGWQINVASGGLISSGLNISGTWTTLLANGTYTTGKWYLVTMTYDGSVMRIYVNGVQSNSTASVGTIQYVNATDNVYIGRNPGRTAGGPNDYFKGVIDEVRIYNRTLSATEIAQYYRASTGSHESTSVSPPNLKSGLVGWWTFDGNDMVPNVRDRSGNGNDGQLHNYTATTSVRGVIGQALETYYPNSQGVRVPDNASLRFTNSLSFSAWVYVNGQQDTYSRLMDKTAVCCGAGYNITLGNGAGGASVNIGGNGGYAAPTWLSFYTWHHVVWSFNYPTSTVYIDLIPATTTSVGSLPDTTGAAFTMGSTQNFCCNESASIRIDDARLYNRALSAAEVLQLYKLREPVRMNKTISQPNLKSGLVTHWTFDGKDLISNVRDLSGYGNTGRLGSFTSTTTVKGKIGQALAFDGISNYVLGSNVVNTPVVTISAWVNLQSYPASLTDLMVGFVNGLGSGTYDKVIQINTAGQASFYVYDGSSKTTTNSPVLSLNKWYHLVGVADGSNIYIYLNGVQAGSNPAGNSFAGYTVPNIFVAGPTGDAPAGYGNAKIDDVRVYNRALSPTEIKQLYKMGQ